MFSALRGPEHTPLPDDEIKDILPWIPPRAVCRVDVKSIAGAKAHGLYIDSFIPPDRLDAACVRENIDPGSSGRGLRNQGRSEDRQPRRIQLHSHRGQLRSAPGGTRHGLHHRQYADSRLHRSRYREDVRAGRGGTSANRRCSSLEQRAMSVPAALRCLAPIVRRVLLAHAMWSDSAGSPQSWKPMESRWRSETDLEQFSAESRPGDLRGQPLLTIASVGPHRARRHRLRCGLPEEPLPGRRDAPAPRSSSEGWDRSRAE